MQPTGSSMPIARGAAVASVGLGFFAMVVFWWYPFGLILSSVGLLIGLTCLIRKVRGLHGENMALIGTTLCAIDVATIITLTQLPQVSILWHL
jgi:hypothetical protein